MSEEKKMNLFDACRILKEKRKKLGITLEKVSSATKLSPAILRRIENQDNLLDMNQVYLKGFIKLYAAYLKEDEIIKNLDTIFMREHKVPEQALPQRKNTIENLDL